MIDFQFIGWCNEQGHDKVWVAFKVENSYYCAWGRRGAKLSFKKHLNGVSLYRVQLTKEGRYQPVDQFMLFSVFPSFLETVEYELCTSLLAGKVR